MSAANVNSLRPIETNILQLNGDGSLQDYKTRLSLIAEQILALAEKCPTDAPSKDVCSSDGTMKILLRNVIKERRLREKYFDQGLFSEPAWDMLLDLALARIEHRNISISSLCIAAAVPTTTALRWIKILLDHNLIIRRADPNDGRRHYIHIRDESFDKIIAIIKSSDFRQ